MRSVPLLCALLPASCDRSEVDRATRPVAAPVDPASATAPASGCIVPLAPAPPPAAQAAEACPPDPLPPATLARGWVGFPEAPGAPRVEVEIARTEPERSRGLMYRTSLRDDGGMLFDFGVDGPRSFWMKNTCIPLDMLFVTAGGTLAGVVEQVPTLDLAPRGVPCPAAWVLEVNAGWTRTHGVAPGQRVVIEAE